MAVRDYTGNKPATVNIATSLPDELNTFYAQFEADNTAHTESAAAAAEEVSPLTLSVADVTRSFRRVNICRPRWDTRPCAQSMRFPASRGFYRYFQSVPLSVCGSLVLQKIHHCAHTKEKQNHMLEWLEARCSDPHLQQVFWEACQRLHLLCAACFTGPTAICIPQ